MNIDIRTVPEEIKSQIPDFDTLKSFDEGLTVVRAPILKVIQEEAETPHPQWSEYVEKLSQVMASGLLKKFLEWADSQQAMRIPKTKMEDVSPVIQGAIPNFKTLTSIEEVYAILDQRVKDLIPQGTDEFAKEQISNQDTYIQELALRMKMRSEIVL